LKRILKLNDLAKYCIKKLYINCKITDEDESVSFPYLEQLKTIFHVVEFETMYERRKFAKFVRTNHEDLLDCFWLFKEMTNMFVNNEKAIKYVKEYQEQKKLKLDSKKRKF
jgi:hypothetical protein